MAQRQLELGTPLEGDSDTNPRHVVAQALTYLQNHQSQMQYAEYRRQGLPLTSSLLASVVKENLEAPQPCWCYAKVTGQGLAMREVRGPLRGARP